MQAPCQPKRAFESNVRLKHIHHKESPLPERGANDVGTSTSLVRSTKFPRALSPVFYHFPFS